MKSRNYNFAPEAFEQLGQWIQNDKKIAKRIYDLAEECSRTPFTGTGKPEPLKGKQYKGYWSRRITEEHRLIYRVDDEFVFILSCYGHYNDK